MSGILGLLGLGVRARTVAVGVEAVRSDLQRGRCRCVVLASDASARARDKLVGLTRGKEVPLVTGPDAETMGHGLGRPPVMAAGVRDVALARGILRATESQR